ncbi:MULTISPECIES: Alw26I/Eco31I/Esp3I family type II restriction endonuclease [Paenibacillus]|uniref:Alw26I/Eco31I/Esp3I family type II restriction endonuclease n=1 Tax=Paenibacillus pabuli TaxID=1472 RepID=A0A855Y6P8_9BACL|nr:MULTISPECIES: Alw26I/Eco31I/Esp3I family type II restriction endonuclease [Paenibacillus]PWW37887.1 Alw26I/Eco31I/Esp3I family type II restriction endonuclease [Paenibacillus pabuli]PXW08114.1 Alw26I/Eco31I/Esp3I family type II restriction endonuclease [Paenibacillus taichungensis]
MAKGADYKVGHPNFLKYEKFIINHLNYKGMPDVYYDGDKVQWEAPSNRKGGKFKDTHVKRKDWWNKKALSLGIDTNTGEWISKTAKEIHPTMMKPCKRCGLELDLRYSYVTEKMIKRVTKLSYFEHTFGFKFPEHVIFFVQRLHIHYGDIIFKDLPNLLKSKHVSEIPILPQSIDAWLQWIEEVLIPSEPKGLLSPGAMSNAPDRLDGFHTLNLCCRQKADSGRFKNNLKLYANDRRAFEHWVEGDWVTADRLMGIIRSDSKLGDTSCLFDGNGSEHVKPCAADHIGPISLGFCHRPEFQFLCNSCNSSKGNRMFVSDVNHLIRVEEAGEKVISWYAKELWDRKKSHISTSEEALRLSKMLRDNRYTFMNILNRLVAEGHYAFLSTFLELERAEFNVKIKEVSVKNHITHIEEIEKNPKENLYVREQQARRLRIAFETLEMYASKVERNALLVTSNEIDEKIIESLKALKAVPEEIHLINEALRKQFEGEKVSEEVLREIAGCISSEHRELASFRKARGHLEDAMHLVAEQLDAAWENDRYTRTLSDSIELLFRD